MSKRMSRREMREAGLLKPKPAPELPEDAEFRPSGGGDHLRPEDRDTREGEDQSPQELIAPPAPTPASPPEAAATESGLDADDDFDAGEPTAAWPAVSAPSTPSAEADEDASAAPAEGGSAASAEAASAASAEDAGDEAGAQPQAEVAAPSALTPQAAQTPEDAERAEAAEVIEPAADRPVEDEPDVAEESAAAGAQSASSEEPQAMAAVAADRDGTWANVNASGTGVTLDATGAEQAPSAQAPSAPSAEPEDLERPSVFDRFTSDEEADPANREELATEEGDEDFAASLRQRLRDEPPVEDGGYATEQIDVSAQGSEPGTASSIVKNVLLFLILIVVGFGLGILIGTYLWGSNSQAAVDVAETMWPLLT